MRATSPRYRPAKGSGLHREMRGPRVQERDADGAAAGVQVAAALRHRVATSSDSIPFPAVKRSRATRHGLLFCRLPRRGLLCNFPPG